MNCIYASLLADVVVVVVVVAVFVNKYSDPQNFFLLLEPHRPSFSHTSGHQPKYDRALNAFLSVPIMHQQTYFDLGRICLPVACKYATILPMFAANLFVADARSRTPAKSHLQLPSPPSLLGRSLFASHPFSAPFLYFALALASFTKEDRLQTTGVNVAQKGHHCNWHETPLCV